MKRNIFTLMLYYFILRMGVNMINSAEQLGRNAGKVWEALNQQGPMNESQLIETTSLRDFELHAAVGWLARENKISKDGDMYTLEDTNLTPEIGSAAGKVYDMLFNEGEVELSEISRLTNIDNKHTFSALGWLAREDKIQFKKNKEQQ
jgi:hypothetical protein